MDTNEKRNLARRRWHGDLNQIPLSIAYAFELRLIIENKDGFHGSLARRQGAKMELDRRAKHGDEKAIAQLDFL